MSFLQPCCYIPHDFSGESWSLAEVIKNKFEDEGLAAGDPDTVEMLSERFPHQHCLGEGSDADPEEAEDESEERDDEEEHPPEPEDEEVLLVEEVVAEDAEDLCVRLAALLSPPAEGATNLEKQ